MTEQFCHLLSNLVGKIPLGSFQLTEPYRLRKRPIDLLVYAAILRLTSPEYIIELGTDVGGSAMMFLEQAPAAKVITIDKVARSLEHPRLQAITGFSSDPEVISHVRRLIPFGSSVMVVHDADHRFYPVLADLRLYGELVTTGQYLVVEDCNIDVDNFGKNSLPGPLAAALIYAAEAGFVLDGKFCCLPTSNPCGYLRKL